MYQRDFLKLANGLRADLKSCIKSRTQRSSLLFRILTYFQEYSEQERPEKYKSFAEFASNNHLEYPIGIPKVDDTSLRRIGAKISEAKQGAAPDIVPLILFYLWTETRREFLALLEEGRDLHDFIGEILDHELSSEQQSRALDVPKLLFIGAKGRGENETRDVSEIAERFTQKSMIVDVVLVDGANADAVARTLPQRIDEAQLFVVVIDELNRGDVARIFGELLTYLELDYRDKEFTLAISGRPISLPKNLVVLATANPFDRSVTDLDDALLRRFIVIMMEPDKVFLEAHLKGVGVEERVWRRTLRLFDILNDALPVGFGHTNFLKVRSIEDLAEVWTGRVQLGLQRALFHERQRYEGLQNEIEELLKIDEAAEAAGEDEPAA